MSTDEAKAVAERQMVLAGYRLAVPGGVPGQGGGGDQEQDRDGGESGGRNHGVTMWAGRRLRTPGTARGWRGGRSRTRGRALRGVGGVGEPAYAAAKSPTQPARSNKHLRGPSGGSAR